MDRRTLSHAIACLRSGRAHQVVAPSGTMNRAMLLMCFLRYVEDNAEDLDIQFTDQERLESILPAYGTAFFTQAQLVSHVVNVAMRLGMDGKAFRKYAESLSTADIKESAPLFDLEPGALKNAESNGTSNLIDKIMLPPRGSNFIEAMVVNLAKRLHDDAVGTSPHGMIRIFDPFCFRGSLLTQIWRVFSGASQETAVELGGSDPDGTNVAITSMRLFINGYRGDYSNFRIEEMGKSAPPSGLYDVVVTYCGAIEIEYKSLPLNEISQGVCNSLKRGGIGIFASRADMLRERRDSEARKQLLENQGLTSCVELIIPSFSSTSFTDALWIIGTHDDPTEPDVFLASLGGDGLAKARPDFYENIHGTAEECAESIKWLTDFVAEQKCLPFLSAKVPIKRILDRRDVSLRFSAYETNIDMESRVQEIASLQTAWSHYQEVVRRMGNANDSFYKALDEIVRRRDEGSTVAG